jgi:glycosyltransferase involved in cell wall biosynthesis
VTLALPILPTAAPTVTVVIPTYNRAHFLPRSLDSVLAQTHEDFEVLVVDDGSSDGTAALMADYRDRDGRVRYLVQPQNAGVSAARNRGLHEARGEFIAFLDSDDEWFPEKLKRQVELFRTLPESVGMIYTGVEAVASNGRRVDLPKHRGQLYRHLLVKNVIHGGGSNVMLRRAAVERAGSFDEHIPAIEDYDYWIRVAKEFEVDFVPEPLVRYYDQTSQDRRSRNARADTDARAKLAARYSAEMRRLGVAHRFLVESSRRALARGDRRAASVTALQAIMAKPTVRAPWEALLLAVTPSRIVAAWRS